MTPSTERAPMPRERPVRVAAIGDLHVGETHAGRYRELFAEISQNAEVLVLCGDLTNYGKAAEAENLAEDLRAAPSLVWRCSGTTITNRTSPMSSAAT